MRKYKLHIQTGFCLVILACMLICGRVEHPVISTWYDTVSQMVMTELTKEDIKETWENVSSILTDAPAKVVSTITAVNDATKYGEPIDEKTTTRIKQVHAVCGGMVLKSGKNEEYGLYIEIKHEDAVSVYGNLTGISVVESERVQRGEIIGSYDSLSNEEFYYELRQNL